MMKLKNEKSINDHRAESTDKLTKIVNDMKSLVKKTENNKPNNKKNHYKYY